MTFRLAFFVWEAKVGGWFSKRIRILPDKALRLLGEDSIFALQLYLWEQPDAGDLIPGSGGCRKLRWAAKGHGKRGGSRVIYYWITEDERILLLDIYAKNESENLSPAQLKNLKRKKP